MKCIFEIDTGGAVNNRSLSLAPSLISWMLRLQRITLSCGAVTMHMTCILRHTRVPGGSIASGGKAMLSQQYRVSYAKLQISVVKAKATLVGLLVFRTPAVRVYHFWRFV